MTDNLRESKLSAVERENKFLTFALGAEEFGIAILKVREIIGMMPITPIPRTPNYLKGIINLRGKVIPVADLRLKFKMDAMEPTDHTCIIVVEVTGANGLVPVGIVVDSVSEVLNIKKEDIEDISSLGEAGLDIEFITGMAKTEGGVKILMDIDRALGGQDYDNLTA